MLQDSHLQLIFLFLVFTGVRHWLQVLVDEGLEVFQVALAVVLVNLLTVLEEQQGWEPVHLKRYGSYVEKLCHKKESDLIRLANKTNVSEQKSYSCDQGVLFPKSSHLYTGITHRRRG